MENRRAIVRFTCGNNYIIALDREITFTTVKGAKRSLYNVIGKQIGNLQRFYGYGKRILVEATIPGASVPFMYTYVNI